MRRVGAARVPEVDRIATAGAAYEEDDTTATLPWGFSVEAAPPGEPARTGPPKLEARRGPRWGGDLTWGGDQLDVASTGEALT